MKTFDLTFRVTAPDRVTAVCKRDLVNAVFRVLTRREAQEGIAVSDPTIAEANTGDQSSKKHQCGCVEFLRKDGSSAKRFEYFSSEDSATRFYECSTANGATVRLFRMIEI